MCPGTGLYLGVLWAQREEARLEGRITVRDEKRRTAALISINAAVLSLIAIVLLLCEVPVG